LHVEAERHPLHDFHVHFTLQQRYQERNNFLLVLLEAVKVFLVCKAQILNVDFIA